ncbi:methyltransferase [Streptomyces sp. NPDC006733]|uniref:methyltransferase n=1 Tax=Streptomyces sp. NPDC006733 TaxID=3155460 RepID=UPI0033F5DF8C
MTDAPWSTLLMEKTDLITPMTIRVAATLRLADHIAAGATSPESLAAKASVQPAALHRLMCHLVGAGVVRLTESGAYELTELGEQLRDDNPTSGRAWLDIDGPIGRGDLAFFQLLQSVRTGESVYASVYGQGFWEEVGADPELSATFDDRMAASMEWVLPALVAHGDWSKVGHLVDVGGGSGTLLAAVVRNWPGLRGTLVDLPGPASAAAQSFTDAGLGDRCTAVAGSFFEELPRDGGVYLLSNVLLNWDDEQAIAILSRCAEAVAADGRVMVLEGLLDIQSDVTELDLRMLVYLNGRMRTRQEMQKLGAAAGLQLDAVTDFGHARSLVEFVPQASRRTAAGN